MNYTSASEVMALIKQGKRSGFGAYRIALNFTWAEVFGSMQGAEWDEITLDMLEAAVLKAGWLQAQRDRYGPIRVVSWLRPPTYNRRAKGATKSEHMKGYAVDWVPLARVMHWVFEDLKKSPFKGGIAMKPGQFIHTDLRGERAEWKY